jgi:hypothetical protein
VRARPVLRRWRDRARGPAESLSERPLVELTESAEVLTFARPVEATYAEARLDALRLRGGHAVAVALRIFVPWRRGSARACGAQEPEKTTYLPSFRYAAAWLSAKVLSRAGSGRSQQGGGPP